jgi:hypothetical protein
MIVESGAPITTVLTTPCAVSVIAAVHTMKARMIVVFKRVSHCVNSDADDAITRAGGVDCCKKRETGQHCVISQYIIRMSIVMDH